MDHIPITIIGAGVVGLAIARECAMAGNDVLVIEKFPTFGQETSARNSEVIHAGLYYPPGSLKACLCVRGAELLYAYCAKHGVSHKRLGKLLIANNEHEERRIRSIYANALACGVKGLRFLDLGEVRELEPDIEVAAAFLSPHTGILDTHGFMKALYAEATHAGAQFLFNYTVVHVHRSDAVYRIDVLAADGGTDAFTSDIVINCAGLGADRIAASAGLAIDTLSYRLELCKGHYFRIHTPEAFAIRHLIYPPPTEVSLGIHVTPDLAGGLRLGPDAAFVEKIDYDVPHALIDEFYESVVTFLPALERRMLFPDTAGIRPKRVMKSGAFPDFVIQEEAAHGLPGFIDLIGIESPGLTSSLAIAEMVREMVAEVSE